MALRATKANSLFVTEIPNANPVTTTGTNAPLYLVTLPPRIPTYLMIGSEADIDAGIHEGVYVTVGDGEDYVNMAERGVAGTPRQHAGGKQVRAVSFGEFINDLVDIFLRGHNSVGEHVFDTNYDVAGKVTQKWVTQANAVNYVETFNAASGAAAGVRVSGADVNSDLELTGKGTGKVKASGSYGEIVNLGEKGGGLAEVVVLNGARNRHRVRLAGNNATIDVNNMSKGQLLILEIEQGTGGNKTCAFDSKIKFETTPTFKTAENGLDVYGIYYTHAGIYLGSRSLGF
jgi:hypothetical protein